VRAVRPKLQAKHIDQMCELRQLGACRNGLRCRVNGSHVYFPDDLAEYVAAQRVEVARPLSGRLRSVGGGR
jgi:hypothetical protein